MDAEKITVLIAEPGKLARVETLNDTLESLQESVGGCVEIYCPFDEDTCILCNEDGKLDGSLPNRAVYDRERVLQDVLFGTIILCGYSEDGFTSLSEAQLILYEGTFRYPQRFYRVKNEIVAIPFVPVNN